MARFLRSPSHSNCHESVGTLTSLLYARTALGRRFHFARLSGIRPSFPRRRPVARGEAVRVLIAKDGRRDKRNSNGHAQPRWRRLPMGGVFVRAIRKSL